MAEIREPAGLGFKIFTIFVILFFLALVAGLITTYDTDSEVAAVAPPVTAAPPAASAPAASAEAASQVPVGAVATGGGGMAGDGARRAMPVFVGLAALTTLATAGIALRRQET